VTTTSTGTSTSNTPDIEGALEMLRPYVFGTPGPPDVPVLETKDAHDLFWKALSAKSKLLGLDAAKQSHVVSQSVELEQVDNETMEYVGGWLRGRVGPTPSMSMATARLCLRG